METATFSQATRVTFTLICLVLQCGLRITSSKRVQSPILFSPLSRPCLTLSAPWKACLGPSKSCPGPWISSLTDASFPPAGVKTGSRTLLAPCSCPSAFTPHHHHLPRAISSKITAYFVFASITSRSPGLPHQPLSLDPPGLCIPFLTHLSSPLYTLTLPRGPGQLFSLPQPLTTGPGGCCVSPLLLTTASRLCLLSPFWKISVDFHVIRPSQPLLLQAPKLLPVILKGFQHLAQCHFLKNHSGFNSS